VTYRIQGLPGPRRSAPKYANKSADPRHFPSAGSRMECWKKSICRAPPLPDGAALKASCLQPDFCRGRQLGHATFTGVCGHRFQQRVPMSGLIGRDIRLQRTKVILHSRPHGIHPGHCRKLSYGQLPTHAKSFLNIVKRHAACAGLQYTDPCDSVIVSVTQTTADEMPSKRLRKAPIVSQTNPPNGAWRKLATRPSDRCSHAIGSDLSVCFAFHLRRG